MKTLNDERTWNTERGRSANASAVWTVTARWTLYSESLGYFPCIVLNLKFGKNLHLYELMNFVILLKHMYFLYIFPINNSCSYRHRFFLRVWFLRVKLTNNCYSNKIIVVKRISSAQNLLCWNWSLTPCQSNVKRWTSKWLTAPDVVYLRHKCFDNYQVSQYTTFLFSNFLKNRIKKAEIQSLIKKFCLFIAICLHFNFLLQLSFAYFICFNTNFKNHNIYLIFIVAFLKH